MKSPRKRLEQLKVLAWNLGFLRGELREARREIAQQGADLRAELDAIRQTMARTAAEQAERDRTLLAAVQFVADQETDNRRRLAALRETEAYERAFSDPEPLVTVTIATYRSYETLVERALPSVFNQTYQNFEVVVVGDAAPPETEEAIAKVNDPRVRYSNLPHRGPYPDQQHSRWQVAGTYPANEARRLARGSWIAPLDDDDSFRQDHIELLLNAARETHREVAYGHFIHHLEDGPRELGVFPPEQGQFCWQAAILHEGLRFVEGEVASALFNLPGDWSRCRRLLRAGVSFTMVPQVVTDCYPSWAREGPGASS